jgi:hypothetical protein
MGLQSLYHKGPQSLLWATSRAASIEMTESGGPDFSIYCVTFIVYITQFTSVVAGRTIQSGGSRVGDRCRSRY